MLAQIPLLPAPLLIPAAAPAYYPSKDSPFAYSPTLSPEEDSLASHYVYSVSDAPDNNNNNPGMTYYLSESPSPVDPQSSLSAITLHQPFLHSAEDPSRSDKYPNLLDQRRMSEPAALSPYSSHNTMNARYQNFSFPYSGNSTNPLHHSRPLYPSSLHRGASTGSLRDLRHHHFEYPPQQHEWKHDDSRPRDHHQHNHQQEYYDQFDEPISPTMHNTFAHSLLPSSTSGMPYSPISDNLYGPSPPGTGTSTSSSVAPLSAGPPCSPSRSISQHLHRSLSGSQISCDLDRKTYSFVALPGNSVKKRPRRRYDEIERLYRCSWPDCNKSYGTLNHLNAHVTMQKHGARRNPNEFKELRKQWRKAKKEQESAAAMRRDSFSDGYDDHQAFQPRYFGAPPHHALQPPPGPPHHQHQHLPSSVTIGTAERYSVHIDDIRYPPQDPTTAREDDALGGIYDPQSARQRYSGGPRRSWPSQNPSRTNAVQQPSFAAASGMSSSLPAPLPTHTQQHHQHAHHSHLPQLEIGVERLHAHHHQQQHQHQHQMPADTLVSARLAPHSSSTGSTLLTPLPGYTAGAPSLIPSLQTHGVGAVYETEVYEDASYDTLLYDNRPGGGAFDDAEHGTGSRPGTGHASLGGQSLHSDDSFAQ